MPPRLQGKVIVVAGAGGIGDELARRYAAEGAAVVVGDLGPGRAKAVAEEITAGGGRAIGVDFDGADEGSIEAIVRCAVSNFGGLDGFHANYASFADGGDGDPKDVLGIPLDQYDEAMRVNARGYLLCTRHAVPELLARGGGSMVYTSSGAVHMGEMVRVAYAMSKSTTHALMRHVALRFGPQGIRANVIAPGVIFHSGFEGVITPEITEGFREVTALKTRLGRPGDIAAMGALLMSDDGSYITGQVLSVDGGTTMRP